MSHDIVQEGIIWNSLRAACEPASSSIGKRLLYNNILAFRRLRDNKKIRRWSVVKPKCEGPEIIIGRQLNQIIESFYMSEVGVKGNDDYTWVVYMIKSLARPKLTAECKYCTRDTPSCHTEILQRQNHVYPFKDVVFLVSLVLILSGFYATSSDKANVAFTPTWHSHQHGTPSDRQNTIK
ncbi:hypothetical protein J6590_053757 [Homalodisca vitripennis]|nr:hypothetical protein J6590_053757 [Homalodisca vitripennis]